MKHPKTDFPLWRREIRPNNYWLKYGAKFLTSGRSEFTTISLTWADTRSQPSTY